MVGAGAQGIRRKRGNACSISFFLDQHHRLQHLSKTTAPQTPLNHQGVSHGAFREDIGYSFPTQRARMLLEPCRVHLGEPKPGQDAPELGKQGKSDNNQSGKGSLLGTSFQTGSTGQLNTTWEVTRISEECWVIAAKSSPLFVFLNNAGPLNPDVG